MQRLPRVTLYAYGHVIWASWQKMPFFRAFITLRSQFHLHHRSQRALTEIVSKITPNLGLVLYGSFPTFARTTGRTSTKLHIIKSIFVTGPSNILFVCVYVFTFQPGHFTGWGSEGVKGSSLTRNCRCREMYCFAQTLCPVYASVLSSDSAHRHRRSDLSAPKWAC